MATELSAVRALNDPPRVPKAILEDRYDGLLLNLAPRNGNHVLGDYNQLQVRLDKVTGDLIRGIIRQEPDDDDVVGRIMGEVQDVVRETIVRRVDELGLAR